MHNQEIAWYTELTKRIGDIADELQLDADGKEKLTNFVMVNAKQQYVDGTRAGIAWARANRS